jgi:hypothetical protein
VSDALDRLTPPGADLLERVDAALVAHGLPPGHPVTALLRRLGALPADVLHAISAWRPAPLRAAASDLRHTADEYERLRDVLAPPPEWAGAAADGFAAHRTALVGSLGETGAIDEAGLAGRLRATAAYLDDVAEWLDRSRGELARSIADALGSTEAVRLHASGDAEAAATIAARILAAAAGTYSCGQAITERWAGRLDEVSYRPPASTPPPAGETRVAL